MKTAEDIQQDYAESKGYNTFYELIKEDVRAVDHHARMVQVIYAKQVAKKALEDAADQAQMIFHCGTTKRNLPTSHHQSGADNLQPDRMRILSTPLIIE